MTTLIVTKELEDELDVLQDEQPNLSDAAWLLLTALYENKDLLDHLHVPSTHPFHSPVFEVKLFSEAHQDGFNIYILKFKDLNDIPKDHRIFLGFNAQRDIYYGLAITDREYSYLTEHWAYRDLLARYEKCQIPKYA